jgi:lauroyl/myristoyl acyltransferase
MLIKRPVQKSEVPSITLKDCALVIWLCMGLALALFPYTLRWNFSKVVARLAERTRRARDARAHAIHIGGYSEADAKRVVRELYAGRLIAILDVMRGLLFGSDQRVTCEGLAHIDVALKRGHGAILWISDFVSAGDVSKLALASAGYRVRHLSRKEHGFSTSKFGINFLNRFRIKYEMFFLEERIVFDRTNPVPARARMLKCLKTNGIVSIVASMHEGVFLADFPFLEGRLKIAIGSLRLARLSKAPVIPVFVLRDRNKPAAFEVMFGEPLVMAAGLPEDEALLDSVCDYRDRLEAYVKKYPESWVGWRRKGQLASEPTATGLP